MVRRPMRSATRWPPRISSERRTWSSWQCQPCAGVDRRPRCWAGSRRSPTSWSTAGPCSAFGMPGRYWPAASSRALRPDCGTPNGGWRRRQTWVSDTQAPSAEMVVVDEEEFRRLPGSIAMYRAGLCPCSGRCARHHEIRPAGARPRT